MVAIATLSVQAASALKTLGTLPTGTVREVRKGLQPITRGVGGLLVSVANTVEKIGDRTLVASQRERMALLQERFKNEDLILRCKLAKALLEFQGRQYRSCLAFLHREGKWVKEEFQDQIQFLQRWKNQIHRNIRNGNYPDPQMALEDLRIITDLVRFEAEIYKFARVGILQSLLEIRGRKSITVKTLTEMRDRQLRG